MGKIKLEVTYTTKPGMRDAFYEKIKELGIDETTRSEAGNEKYDYTIPEEADILYLSEIWADEEALQGHAASEHMKKLSEIKAEYVLDTKIEKSVE